MPRAFAWEEAEALSGPPSEESVMLYVLSLESLTTVIGLGMLPARGRAKIVRGFRRVTVLTLAVAITAGVCGSWFDMLDIAEAPESRIFVERPKSSAWCSSPSFVGESGNSSVPIPIPRLVLESELP